MPKPSSGSTASGPTSVRSFTAKFVPPSKVDRVQTSLEALKIRSPSSDLPEDPGLAVVRRSSAGLAPGNKATRRVPPGLTRVPSDTRGELNQGTERAPPLEQSAIPGQRRGGPATSTLDPPVPGPHET
eukprot:2789691-Amphidinium_carterae.1